MKCPMCQHENREEAVFCLECGARIAEATPDSTRAIIPTFGDAYAKILLMDVLTL